MNEIIKCPHCSSTNTHFKGQHNNQRKKVRIYMYQCGDCRKRFNIEDKEHYNHKGNFYTRKPWLYDEDLRKVEPDMMEDETAVEYWKRKFNMHE